MTRYVYPYETGRQATERDPTEWEAALAAALEEAFGRGHHDLDALLAALNASRVKPREGGRWTAENFTATVRELGA